MSAPTLYHVNCFGAFDGDTSSARRSPADDTEVWLIPEDATLEAPPVTTDDEVAVLRNGQWFVLPDCRGQVAYDKTTRALREIDAPGALGDNETLQAPPSPRPLWSEGGWSLPLAEAIELRRREVDAEIVARNAAGFAYQGKSYQLDDTSQARIAALAVLASNDWPNDFCFIAADNVPVAFDRPGFLAFAAAAARASVTRRRNARSLKDAINAATSAEAVAAIDIKSGWA